MEGRFEGDKAARCIVKRPNAAQDYTSAELMKCGHRLLRLFTIRERRRYIYWKSNIIAELLATRKVYA